jgi:urease accessory protein
VGRDGSLFLRFVRRGSSTILTGCRFELPLQVLAPIQQEDGSAYLLLLNPTGGVLGGDRLNTTIELGPHSHARLSTPSATRVYKTAGAPAILETHIKVGAGAVLEYVPDLLIPHGGSALHQKLTIELEPGSIALFADGLAAGRLAHGERWSFHEITHHTAVTRGTKPLFIDRFVLRPRQLDPCRRSLMEDYNYLFTFGAFTDATVDWLEMQKSIDSVFSACAEVRGGTHLLASGGMICRFLGKSAIEVRETLLQISQRTQRLMLPGKLSNEPGPPIPFPQNPAASS